MPVFTHTPRRAERYRAHFCSRRASALPSIPTDIHPALPEAPPFFGSKPPNVAGFQVIWHTEKTADLCC